MNNENVAKQVSYAKMDIFPTQLEYSALLLWSLLIYNHQRIPGRSLRFSGGTGE